MGSATVFNAARMQAIEDGTVTTGHVDGNGHLQLEHHDGTVVDAGKVTADNLADASTTVPGIVRLATDAETLSGVDDDIAVTPQGLADKAATSAEVIAGTDNTKLVTPKGVFDALASNRQIYSGTVDPTWSGFGATCPVILDANQSDSGTKNAIYDQADTKIQPGVIVTISRVGGTTGKYFLERAFPSFPPFPKQIPITLQGTWGLYNDFNVDDSESYGIPRYQQSSQVGAKAGYIYANMSRYGIVRVEGLVQNSSASPALPSLIGTLPVGMWPVTEAIFAVVNGGGSGNVIVTTDGRILFNGATANTFFSLSPIRFRAKSAVDIGLCTYIPIEPYLTTTWKSYTGTYYTGGSTSHIAAYSIDPDGVVLFDGSLVAVSNYSQDVTIATLTDMPFSYANACHQLTNTPGISTGPIRFDSNKTLNIGFSVSAGRYVILNHVSLVDPNSTTTKTINSNGRNNWIGYGQGWRSPSLAVTPDGQVYLFGLWAAGPMGAAAQMMSSYNRARFKLILTAISANGLSRVDMEASDGMIIPMTGSNAWFSLDGVDYASYRKPPSV